MQIYHHSKKMLKKATEFRYLQFSKAASTEPASLQHHVTCRSTTSVPEHERSCSTGQQRQQDSGLGSTLYAEEEESDSPGAQNSTSTSPESSPSPPRPPLPASAPPLPANPPPNISATLAKGKVVIRPVACRPAPSPGAARLQLGTRLGERYGSTPSLVQRPGSRLALYGSSNDLRPYGGTVQNYSLDRKLSSASAGRFDVTSPPSRRLGLYLGDSTGACSSLPPVPAQPPAPLDSEGRVTWQRGCAESSSRGSLPPSPGSESGDGELEAALRERDVEIGQLRDTLERNEAAIFTVYEEKERAWEREVRKLRALYETRLRASQQKALRVEQTLATHTYQLQQETRRLKTELNTAQTENERSAALVAELRQELAVLRARLDDTEWGLCHKSGELALIKAQLKDSQGEQASRSHELISLRAELREAQASLAASDQRAEQRLTAERAAFQEERLTWLREKEQVLHYQRRLQLNYVHMYRRTRTLEAQLDGGDLKKERTTSGGDVEERAVLCKPAARRGLVPTLENHTIEL